MESQAGTSEVNQSNRKRAITACLTCRHRKVKCDHAQPVCSPCKKGNRVCTYASPQSTSQPSRLASGNRVSRSNRQIGQDDIKNRLERLEQLLERALTGGPAIPQHPADTASNPEHPLSIHQGPGSSQNPQSETLSTDGYDGALLLEGQGGQSRWVSSLHYSLLADEIRDVKMLLGGQSDDTLRESLPTVPSESPFPFSGPSTNDLRTWAPPSADTCLTLLGTFYSNVDPMTRIVHKPTLKRRLIQYIDYTYGMNASSSENEEPLVAHSGEDIHPFEPLALAVFYSAINSLLAEDVLLQFSIEKETLLSQFQHGVQVGLGREKFLTTPSIEVLQAFVLLLTCQSREDDMAKTWTLLGLAHKMALSQGLHREPSLFTSTGMDVVQVEIRRRLWHQICHLDYRSAESRGQEPTISDEDFTTFLPLNISDEALVEGSLDEPSATHGLTDMTVHLIRLYGHHCFRRIVRGTYKLERMTKSQEAKNDDNTSPVAKLRSLFEEVRGMVPEQRMAIGLATVVEWRCWSIFWLRTPKQYRELVITPEVRHIDKDAQRFGWHIGGHACFQPIMHIVSELDMPNFDAPNRQALPSRALDALKKTMLARGREATPMWNAMNRIISNCVAKSTSRSFPVTPFPAVRTDLPINATTQGLGSSATVPSSALLPDMPAFGDFTSSASLPDPTALGSIEMLEPDIMFDWEFWNIDPAAPSLL
ncbi:C6 transcription factor [Fusarium tjaetaba]|uniref:C6 transcription factor n=1 Tax=Fusarium tjaetaba TaxID=1567544 RepID=A0A8H5RMA0_9HYPO|nr:C6 transcription factor [Fusarium tjaetaba]KAF5635648.1 C6 transcription factor [Fusarium tjaetaba]